MDLVTLLPSTIVLARAQFGFTIAFIIFPAFSMGLASFLAVLEAGWLITRQSVYFDTYKYWLRIFAVGFAIGVVSGLDDGLVEIGTNSAGYPGKGRCAILGPWCWHMKRCPPSSWRRALLGIMLFSRTRSDRRLHFAATCLVAAPAR